MLFVIPALIGFSNTNAQKAVTQKEPGINVSFMDKSVKPNDDFFKFVNGTWLKNTEIPADKTRWGSFDELRQNTDKDVLAILAEATKGGKYKPTSDQGKAIIMYQSALDTVARNKQGIAHSGSHGPLDRFASTQ